MKIRAKVIIFSFLSLLILHTFSRYVSAEIIVHDMVIVKNEKVLLKAETKGKFLHKGGELVEFFIDGKTIGKTLSGGDGFAYREFTSSKTGMHKITVKSTNYEASGILLILSKGSKIVFVDFEEGLLEGKLLKKNPKDGSQSAIKEINKRYPVIILQTGLISKQMIREWIKKHGYMDLPITAWDSGDIFEELVQKGIIIKAVIGSNAVIDSASKYKPLSFSFTKKEGSEQVSRWDEIRRKLLKN